MADDTHPTCRQPTPVLDAVATTCMIIVLYLIFFTPTSNWPVVILAALIGLVCGREARRV